MLITRLQFLLFCVGFFYLESLSPCSCNEYNTNVGCLQAEKQALLKFKEGLNDSKNRLSSWLGEDCCNWRGIHCSNKTGHVVKLDLRNTCPLPTSMLTTIKLDDRAFDEFDKWCLSGEISPSLLDLKHLKHLDLSRNEFGGIQIPKFFGSFKRLKYLNLSQAGFGGKVPHELGNLSTLNYLDINDDYHLQVHYVAELPRFFSTRSTYNLHVDSLGWVSHLSSLKHLDLTNVNLSLAINWLPPINTIPSLQTFLCPFCSLATMNMNMNPTSLPLVNFTSLSSIDLSFNNLGPEIPTWLFNMSSLVELYLSNNIFNDSVSIVLGCLLCNTQLLRLSGNELWGNMNGFPDQYSSRCNTSRLEGLDLADNRLSGHLPNWLGQFTNLKYLFLDDNSFSGPIPVSLGNLLSLEKLYLSGNQLGDTIPESFGQLSNLVSLLIDKNYFEGVLTETHFANLTNLETLVLSSNLLALNVSSTWIPPFHLKSIAIDDCKLGPQFPSWLQTQNKLEYVSMSNASISSTIPNWFWNISSNLFYVDLSENSLSTTVPASIGETGSNILHLSLSSNTLSGNIAVFVCRMKYLESLILSNNHFTGEIPQCIGNLPLLSILDLGNNNLTGAIPSKIGNSRGLRSLHLDGNKLSGNLPLSLKFCSHLKTLDLGENHLSGELPPWLGERLEKLQFLILRSNKFEGSLPPQLSLLSQLQVLDLSQNMLSGRIPASFGNFSSMAAAEKTIEPILIDRLFIQQESIWVSFRGSQNQYTRTASLVKNIDLSRNNLFGKIPEEITSLAGLQSLNLSGNHLSGTMPKKIGNMKWIESLDLSSNQLVGEIPSSMVDLTFLSHLNLSYNNLSGRIPSGHQLDTFHDISIYFGNPGLCGPPLPSECSGDALSKDPKLKDRGQETKGRIAVLTFFACISLGFVVGFWIFCGSLLLKRSWRVVYFRFIDDFWDQIYVLIFRIKVFWREAKTQR